MAHETSLSHLSDFELNSLFREAAWTSPNMTPADRQQACQELENRLAAERGEQPREVVLTPMNGSTYGVQSGNCIYLNASLVENHTLTAMDDNGNVLGTYRVDAPGWQLYDTVCHEDEHGAQYDRGQFQTGLSYIECESDYSIYRISPDEMNAFNAGQQRTISAINEQIQARGTIDPDMKAYIDDMLEQSATSALEEARARYNDPNIDKTLAEFVYNQEHGIVPENPSPSYQQLMALKDEQDMRHAQENSAAAVTHSGQEVNTRDAYTYQRSYNQTPLAQSVQDQQNAPGASNEQSGQQSDPGRDGLSSLQPSQGQQNDGGRDGLFGGLGNQQSSQGQQNDSGRDGLFGGLSGQEPSQGNGQSSSGVSASQDQEDDGSRGLMGMQSSDPGRGQEDDGSHGLLDVGSYTAAADYDSPADYDSGYDGGADNGADNDMDV